MAKILWLDLETTGLDPMKHGVTEIAAVLEEDGKEVDSFQEYVCPTPGLEFTDKALQITRFTMEDVVGFPAEREVMRRFIPWLRQYVNPYDRNHKLILAGFNVDFDAGFLARLLARAKEPGGLEAFFYWHVLDVRSFTTWALRDRWPVMANGKLMSVASQILTKQEMLEAMGGGEAHGASVDLRVTIETFRKVTRGVELCE